MMDKQSSFLETSDLIKVKNTSSQDYGYVNQYATFDFINDDAEQIRPFSSPDFIFMNPPFTLAEDFIRRAIELSNFQSDIEMKGSNV